MTRILHRQIRNELPVAASGHGIYILDARGHEYIDASGGAAVSCLGHDHPEVKTAIRAQLDKLP
jgi:adenosylmethionine-8-amino-7-oxononanoate aminotransferase